VEALATAMKSWAGHPQLDLAARNEMHAKVAEIFSLQRAAKDLTELYLQVLTVK